jgi:hypothetical protein
MKPHGYRVSNEPEKLQKRQGVKKKNVAAKQKRRRQGEQLKRAVCNNNLMKQTADYKIADVNVFTLNPFWPDAVRQRIVSQNLFPYLC